MAQSRDMVVSRTDTIQFSPFDVSTGALQVTITPHPHDAPITGGAIPFRAQFSEEGIKPIFNIHVDIEKATKQTRVPELTLGVAAFIRDFEAKRYRVLERWSAGNVPSRWEVDDTIQITSRAEIGVVLYLMKERKRANEFAHRLGSTLEKASITIVQESQPVIFPVLPKTPADFANDDLPADSVWAVKFKSSNVDAPPADVIEVWINQKYLDLLQRSDVRGVVTAVTASIYASIARGTLFRARLPPKDEEGLLAKIIKGLKDEYSIEEKALLLRAADYQDALVEAASQIAVDLHKRLR